MWPMELVRSSADLFFYPIERDLGDLLFSVYRDLLTCE